MVRPAVTVLFSLVCHFMGRIFGKEGGCRAYGGRAGGTRGVTRKATCETNNLRKSIRPTGLADFVSKLVRSRPHILETRHTCNQIGLGVSHPSESNRINVKLLQTRGGAEPSLKKSWSGRPFRFLVLLLCYFMGRLLGKEGGCRACGRRLRGRGRARGCRGRVI